MELRHTHGNDNSTAEHEQLKTRGSHVVKGNLEVGKPETAQEHGKCGSKEDYFTVSSTIQAVLHPSMECVSTPMHWCPNMMIPHS